MKTGWEFKSFLKGFLLFYAAIPTIVFASVTYVFDVTNYPDDAFHQPFSAELVFSDSAVDAGVAYIDDIESLRISAGHTMPESDPLTMDYLHSAFTDVQFNFSADKEVIVSVFARISPHMQNVDHIVLYRPNPPHPQVDIHEHIGQIARDYVRIETSLEATPLEQHLSVFKGEWKREHLSIIIGFFDEYFTCFPYCPLPWVIIILVAVLILGGVVFRVRKR
ncbi:hypothetical protein [Kaarinaea lacus]